MVKPKDDFIEPEEVTLKIPGVERKYTFLHITDSHVTTYDESSTEEEKENAIHNTEMWRGWSKGYAIPALEAVVDYAAEIGVDAIIHTGDVMDYYTEVNEKKINECFERQKQIPLILAHGNHDGGKELAPAESILKYINYGAFAFIALDISDHEITTEDFALLKNLCTSGKPVIIVQHIPFNTDDCREPILKRWNNKFLIGTEDDSEITNAYRNFVVEEENDIAAVLCGHIHFSLNSHIKPEVPQFIAAPTQNGYCRIVNIVGE